MNLDKGICTVFRKRDAAQPGGMPAFTYDLIYQSWYGEPSFETSPAYPTEKRRELETAARIRVLQNRDLRQHDVVVLRLLSAWEELQAGEPVYRITRAFHGLDDDGPTEISDLTLEVYTP